MSDGEGGGEAKERSDETKTKTRQGETYEREGNKPISSYISEETYAPSSGPTSEAPSTTCMAPSDRYRGARFCGVGQRRRANSVMVAKA